MPVFVMMRVFVVPVMLFTLGMMIAMGVLIGFFVLMGRISRIVCRFVMIVMALLVLMRKCAAAYQEGKQTQC